MQFIRFAFRLIVVCSIHCFDLDVESVSSFVVYSDVAIKNLVCKV
jgi:hypothetical protein